LAKIRHYEVQEMYRWLLRRSAAQALGYMQGVRSLLDQVIYIFWHQILQTVRICSSRYTLLRPTLSITVAETRKVYSGRQKRCKLKVEVTRVKPSSFQHVPLRQKRLLSLLSYFWHYNRHFTFTCDNRKHP